MEITDLLVAWRNGDPTALDRLMPIVYGRLVELAEGSLRRERMGHTLQPAALVNEAYMRMVDKTHPRFEGRVHFYAVAAKVMRRVLIDYARRRNRVKRGGGAVLVQLDDQDVASDGEWVPDIFDLDAAMERLGAFDERKARTIELHYLGGLNADEVADVLRVSVATVRLDLRMGKAWLRHELSGGAA